MNGTKERKKSAENSVHGLLMDQSCQDNSMNGLGGGEFSKGSGKQGLMVQKKSKT